MEFHKPECHPTKPVHNMTACISASRQCPLFERMILEEMLLGKNSRDEWVRNRR
jgi:hypothetical protein